MTKEGFNVLFNTLIFYKLYQLHCIIHFHLLDLFLVKLSVYESWNRETKNLWKMIVFEGHYWNKLEISWQKGIIIVLLFEAEHPSVLIESKLPSINIKVIKQKTGYKSRTQFEITVCYNMLKNSLTPCFLLINRCCSSGIKTIFPLTVLSVSSQNIWTFLVILLVYWWSGWSWFLD